MSRDILLLVQCLRQLNEYLTEDMAYEMEKALEHLLSPEKTSEKVFEALLASDTSVSPQ